jgi:hypothetical protein
MFKKLFNKTTVLLLSAILIVGAYNALQTAPQDTQVRNIPGITTADMFPQACVGCHKNYTEQNLDVRLTTIFKAWAEAIPPALLAKYQAAAPEGVTLKGKHPMKPNDGTSIPEDCNKCHGKSMKTALPMGQIMHITHLTGGKDNKFITMFGGECSHCHKLDQKTGNWTIPNGKENEVK